MKVILAKTPWGEYHIPLKYIAEKRADYYAPKGSDDWKEEVEHAMTDDYDAIDWLVCDMEWDDVKEIATKVSEKVLVDEDDFWSSTDDFDIIDVK